MTICGWLLVAAAPLGVLFLYSLARISGESQKRADWEHSQHPQPEPEPTLIEEVEQFLHEHAQRRHGDKP